MSAWLLYSELSTCLTLEFHLNTSGVSRLSELLRYNLRSLPTALIEYLTILLEYINLLQ